MFKKRRATTSTWIALCVLGFATYANAQTALPEIRKYTTGCGGEKKPGEMVEVKPKEIYRLHGYGFEMGFHCGQDNGTFAFLEHVGDFDVVVQVESLYTADGKHHTRAGIMARKLPATNEDIFVNIGVASNYTDNHFADLRHFAIRLEKGGNLFNKKYQYHAAVEDHPDHHSRMPLPRQFPKEWLRLKREGNRFFGYYAYGDDLKGDNIAWRTHRRFDKAYQEGPDNSFQIDLGSKVALGLFVEGSPEHDPNAKSTAVIKVLKGLFPGVTSIAPESNSAKKSALNRKSLQPPMHALIPGIQERDLRGRSFRSSNAAQ